MTFTRRSALAGLAASACLPAWANATPPSAKSLAVSVVDGPFAAALKITDEDKAPISMDQWLGHWVVLSLWAPWCKQCHNEMPSVARMAKALDPEHIRLLPLAFDRRGPYFVRRYLKQNDINDLPVFLGDGVNLDDTLSMHRLPSTAILDPKGQVTFTITGEAVWDDAETLAWLNGLG